MDPAVADVDAPPQQPTGPADDPLRAALEARRRARLAGQSPEAQPRDALALRLQQLRDTRHAGIRAAVQPRYDRFGEPINEAAQDIVTAGAPPATDTSSTGE